MGSATDQKFREWAKRIRLSDERAFADLFHTVYPRMIKFAWRYTRAKSPAQDVVQESFIKLWKLRKHIDPNRSLKAYMYQIVRSRALNYIRDVDHHSSIEDVPLHRLKVQSEAFPKIMEEEAYDEKMSELIAQLPDRQCEAMQLSRFEGLEHDEIAEIMQISPRTVNNHIVAALKTLREEWNAYKSNQTE